MQDGIFENLEDARIEIFEYIEMYFNNQRGKLMAIRMTITIQLANHDKLNKLVSLIHLHLALSRLKQLL